MKRNPRNRGNPRKPIYRHAPPGSPPGTWSVEKSATPVQVKVMAYDDSRIIESDHFNPSQVSDLQSRLPVVWIDVVGLTNADLINQLGQLFQIHRLALEDVVHTHQRPKVDIYDEHLYIALALANKAHDYHKEQISLFLGKNYVITLQEFANHAFEPVRDRLRQNIGRIRKSGPDYLIYALTDVVIDLYFPVVEEKANLIDQLEERILKDQPTELVREIHLTKEAMAELNRTVWNHSELVKNLIRNPGGYFTEATTVYLRDCYDHSLQLLEYSGTYRESAASLLDLYLLMATHKSNEVMKFLTIQASIFIPLTFIAGVYGMNFKRMPELEWEFGYPLSLLCMAFVAVGMLVYFKRKGWLNISS